MVTPERIHGQFSGMIGTVEALPRGNSLGDRLIRRETSMHVPDTGRRNLQIMAKSDDRSRIRRHHTGETAVRSGVNFRCMYG